MESTTNSMNSDVLKTTGKEIQLRITYTASNAVNIIKIVPVGTT
jgi:hypothetical protein